VNNFSLETFQLSTINAISCALLVSNASQVNISPRTEYLVASSNSVSDVVEAIYSLSTANF